MPRSGIFSYTHALESIEVACSSGCVDEAVATGNGRGYGFSRLIGRRKEDAESECWHIYIVAKFQCWTFHPFGSLHILRTGCLQ
jgi:hypothetical protein